MTILLPGDLTEDQGLDLVNALDQRFDWASIILTRDDAEAFLNSPLTDDQWETLRSSRDWKTAIPEAMAEAAASVLLDFTRDLLPELEN